MEDVNFHKELDLVQDVIKRMASNSFEVKKWGISIVAVIFALQKDNLIANEKSYPMILLLILVVLIAFWYLDAYFLRLERMFRKHYEWLIRNREDANRIPYDLSVGKYVAQVDSNLRIMFSDSLLPFYGIPAVLIVGLSGYYFFF